MKLLKTSNYENKEVINFIKTQFSIIESAKCQFCTSEFLEMDKLQVSFDGATYAVALLGLRRKEKKYHLCDNLKSDVTKDFTSRTDAIKFILYHLGIIKKSEIAERKYDRKINVIKRKEENKKSKKDPTYFGGYRPVEVHVIETGHRFSFLNVLKAAEFMGVPCKLVEDRLVRFNYYVDKVAFIEKKGKVIFEIQ